MPLIKLQIKASIQAVFDAEKDSTDDPSVSRERIANKLAEVIINAIKSQTIIIVATAGPNPVTVASIVIQ